MFIVYASLALVIGSIAYMGYAVFNTAKAAKPAIHTLNEVAGRMQVKADTLKSEADKLKQTQKRLMDDVNEKKLAINSAVFAVKQTPAIIKGIAKTRPVAQLELRRKGRMWSLGRRT